MVNEDDIKLFSEDNIINNNNKPLNLLTIKPF